MGVALGRAGLEIRDVRSVIEVNRSNSNSAWRPSSTSTSRPEQGLAQFSRSSISVIRDPPRASEAEAVPSKKSETLLRQVLGSARGVETLPTPGAASVRSIEVRSRWKLSRWAQCSAGSSPTGLTGSFAALQERRAELKNRNGLVLLFQWRGVSVLMAERLCGPRCSLPYGGRLSAKVGSRSTKQGQRIVDLGEITIECQRTPLEKDFHQQTKEMWISFWDRPDDWLLAEDWLDCEGGVDAKLTSKVGQELSLRLRPTTLAYAGCAPGTRLAVKVQNSKNEPWPQTCCGTVVGLRRDGLLDVCADNVEPTCEPQAVDPHPNTVAPARELRYGTGQRLLVLRGGLLRDAEVLRWHGLEYGNRHRLRLSEGPEFIDMDLNEANHAVQRFVSGVDYEAARTDFCTNEVATGSFVNDEITGNSFRVAEELIFIPFEVDFVASATASEGNAEDTVATSFQGATIIGSAGHDFNKMILPVDDPGRGNASVETIGGACLAADVDAAAEVMLPRAPPWNAGETGNDGVGVALGHLIGFVDTSPGLDGRHAIRPKASIEGIAQHERRFELNDCVDVRDLVRPLLGLASLRSQDLAEGCRVLLCAPAGAGKSWCMLQLHMLLARELCGRVEALPDALPLDWEVEVDSDGRDVYINRKTLESRWDRPISAKSADVAPQTLTTDCSTSCGVPVRMVPLLVQARRLACVLQKWKSTHPGTLPLSLLLEYIRTEQAGADRTRFRLMLEQALELRAMIVLVDGINEAAGLRADIDDFLLHELVGSGVPVVATTRVEGTCLRRFIDRSFSVFGLAPLGAASQKALIQKQLPQGSAQFDNAFELCSIRKEFDRIYHKETLRRGSGERRHLELFQVENLDRRQRARDSTWHWARQSSSGEDKIQQRCLDGSRYVTKHNGVPQSQQILMLSGRITTRILCAIDEALAGIPLDARDEEATAALEQATASSGATALRLGLLVHQRRRRRHRAEPKIINATKRSRERSRAATNAASSRSPWSDALEVSPSAQLLWPQIMARTDELFVVAERLYPAFTAATSALLERAGMNPLFALQMSPLKDPVRLHEEAVDDADGARFITAGTTALFGSTRRSTGPCWQRGGVNGNSVADARAQATLENEDGALPEASVTDVLHARMLFDDLSHALRVMELLLVGFETNFNGAPVRLLIARCRNEFAEPSPTRMRRIVNTVQIHHMGVVGYAEYEVHHRTLFAYSCSGAGDRATGHSEFLKKALKGAFETRLNADLNFMLEERMRVFEELAALPGTLALLVAVLAAREGFEGKCTLPGSALDLCSGAIDAILRKRLRGEDMATSARRVLATTLLRRLATTQHVARTFVFGAEDVEASLSGNPHELALWIQLNAEDGVPLVRPARGGGSQKEFAHSMIQEAFFVEALARNEVSVWGNDDSAAAFLNDAFYLTAFRLGGKQLGGALAAHRPFWSFKRHKLTTTGWAALSALLPGARSLRALRLDRNHMVTGTLEPLSQLSGLEVLTLDETNFTGGLQHLLQLSALQELSLRETSLEGSLGQLSWLVMLKKLHIHTGHNIGGGLDALSRLRSLEDLSLKMLAVEGTLEPIIRLPLLKFLEVHTCPRVCGTLQPLNDTSQRDQLQSLVVVATGVGGSIDSLARTQNLRTLMLGSEGIESAPQTYTNFDLGSIDDRRHFSGSLRSISIFRSLEELMLTNCSEVVGDLDAVAHLSVLRRLDLRRCRNITGTLEPLVNLAELIELDLSFTSVSGDLKPLLQLKRLRLVALRNTQVEGTLMPLSRLLALESLDLRNCPRLTGTQETMLVLSVLPRLRDVKIEDTEVDETMTRSLDSTVLHPPSPPPPAPPVPPVPPPPILAALDARDGQPASVTPADVETFLVHGLKLEESLRELVSGRGIRLSAVIFFALNTERASVALACRHTWCAGDACLAEAPPVCLVEAPGIVGFDRAAKRNVEFLDDSYGTDGVVVVVAYSGDGIQASHEDFAPDAFSIMAIADSSGAFEAIAHKAPAVYYGGVAKAIFMLSPRTGDFEQVQHFFVSSLAGRAAPIGLTTMDADDASDAVDRLLAKLPREHRTSGTVALFSCFLQGVNWYGSNDVETSVIARKVEDCRIYGMFCYGEMGPSSFSGFIPPALPEQDCEVHAVTSVVAVHTRVVS